MLASSQRGSGQRGSTTSEAEKAWDDNSGDKADEHAAAPGGEQGSGCAVMAAGCTLCSPPRCNSSELVQVVLQHGALTLDCMLHVNLTAVVHASRSRKSFTGVQLGCAAAN